MDEKKQQKQKVFLQQWPFCRLEKQGRVYILTLTGNDDHRFNPSSIDDIVAALKTVEQYPDAGALVTTNEGRFMKEGKEVLYMSELDHGMYMPRSLMSVIKSKIVLPKTLNEVLLKARKFKALEAFDHGFVDGVYEDSEKTLEAALLEAEKLASRNWKRDSYANLRAGAFAEEIGAISALASESIALRDGLQHAQQLQIEKLEVQQDAKALDNHVNQAIWYSCLQWK
ncbi:hypothetical protein NE237_009294 [Protea cynaroides]|uniref:Uncharacterized protein n=1 Tax=Protea cynaroides TaxID=273540 RepID=A0A9Q0KXN8_9MAGN|nr:hypothetical protein NE237_009294 [Protea cynaroides]